MTPEQKLQQKLDRIGQIVVNATWKVRTCKVTTPIEFVDDLVAEINEVLDKK